MCDLVRWRMADRLSTRQWQAWEKVARQSRLSFKTGHAYGAVVNEVRRVGGWVFARLPALVPAAVVMVGCVLISRSAHDIRRSALVMFDSAAAALQVATWKLPGVSPLAWLACDDHGVVVTVGCCSRLVLFDQREVLSLSKGLGWRGGNAGWSLCVTCTVRWRVCESE
jgi:hypothetical protein